MMKQPLTTTRARLRGALQALDQIRILCHPFQSSSLFCSLVCAITRACGVRVHVSFPAIFFLNHVFLCFNLATSESKHIRALQLKGLP